MGSESVFNVLSNKQNLHVAIKNTTKTSLAQACSRPGILQGGSQVSPAPNSILVSPAGLWIPGVRRQAGSTVPWLDGYLHSQDTSCFSEIQNPPLGGSQCMPQHRGESCYSSGLSQAPVSALPAWWLTSDRLCCWNFINTSQHKPPPVAPLKTYSNHTFSFSMGPRRNTINSAIERSSVQSNGFSPSKLLDLRKMPVHWVPDIRLYLSQAQGEQETLDWPPSW